VSTAVTEKPTTKPQRSRLEELTAALDHHKQEFQRYSTELADLSAALQSALDEALAKAPAESPWRVNGEPHKLRERMRKVEEKLDRLGPVMDTLTAQVNRESALKAVAEVQAATKRMRALNKEAEADLREIGEMVAGITEVWNRYADNRDVRAALRLEIEAALKSVRMLEPETAAAWDDLEQPEGPQPAKDIGALLDQFVDIIFDAFNNGYRGAMSDAVDAFGRTYEVEGGDRSYGRRLPNLLPDCRGQDRRIGGPGIEKFARSIEPGANFSLR
jgi:hypothetical protein